MPLIDVTDTRLHVEDTGGDGPAVVLAHSWCTSARAWDAQLVDLARDHRVVAYDQRGAGRSDRPAAGYSIEGGTEDLLGLLDVLALDRPVVVGHSLGGLYALEAGRRGRAAAIVLVDAPFHAAMLAPDAIGAFVDGLHANRPRAVADAVPQWFAADADPILGAAAQRQILDASPFAEALQLDATRYDPRPWLPDLAVPALVLHGRDDAPTPVAVAAECAALIPDAELHVVEGAGHMPHQERPDEVNAAIRRFVSRVAA